MTPPSVLIRPSLSAFGKELRAARLHAGLSKQQLAQRARMTRQGLFKIERGGNVTLGTIVLLADALGCHIADFFPEPTDANLTLSFRADDIRRAQDAVSVLRSVLETRQRGKKAR
jgi:transcriptional regulator with XRE-family HTH domain